MHFKNLYLNHVLFGGLIYYILGSWLFIYKETENNTYATSKYKV